MSSGDVVNDGKFRLAEWFPALDKLELFLKYNLILSNFANKLNLVSLKTLPFADVIHFADSILGSRIVLKVNGGAEIYDFGSGNGFPGVVMALIAPERKIKLVEADARKIEFLRYLIDELGVTNCELLHGRVEELAASSVEVAIARGFLPLAKALLTTRRVIKHGGHFYHFKSEEWGREVATIPSQLCSVWRPSLVESYRLPVGGVSFAIVDTERLSV